MTVLFSGSRNIAAGDVTSSNFAISAAIKRAGFPLSLSLSLEAEPFPIGTTTIEASLSLDSGTTWRMASMTVVMPAVFKGPPPHFWTMSFNLSNGDEPTHARFRTIAPSAFTTNVVIAAV
jgi:hypothetical protein